MRDHNVSTWHGERSLAAARKKQSALPQNDAS